MFRTLLFVATFLFSGLLLSAEPASSKNIPEHLSRPATTIEWTDLLPAEDLKLLESIPQVDHESLSAEELAMDTAPSGLKSNSAFESNDSSALDDQVANAIAEASKQASER